MSKPYGKFALVCLAALTLAASGCGMAMTGGRMVWNASKKDSNLKIYLDGHQAKQNTLKKAYFGHASFEVKEPVSTTPNFMYEFIDPAKFGRITNVSMQIHQEYEGDFSHQAEYVIHPAHPNDSTTLLQPGATVSLGNAPSNYKVVNFEKQTVNGVKLTPGMDYMLVFTVAGDRSETVQILFHTR